MKKTIIYFIILIFIQKANAQYEPTEICPVIGWDSLKALIKYPEIAKRAGVQGNVDVSIYFDSLGNIGDIKIIGYEIFYHPITEAIKNVKWSPRGSIAFHPRREYAYFTVEFKLKPYERPTRRINK